MENPNAIMIAENRTPPIPSIEVLASLERIVSMAVRSGMAKTKNPSDAIFIALYAWELGIAPMTGLRTIYSVNGGAPTCSGELMLALIRRSGKAATIRISSTEETLKQGFATVYSKRSDSGDEFTAKWGKEDDTRAGLKSNRDKYPAQMWTWRAVSIMNKVLYSDVNAGLYTVEEIYPNTQLDEFGDPIGEIIPGEVKQRPADEFKITIEKPEEPPPQPQVSPTPASTSETPQSTPDKPVSTFKPVYGKPNGNGTPFEFKLATHMSKVNIALDEKFGKPANGDYKERRDVIVAMKDAGDFADCANIEAVIALVIGRLEGEKVTQ